MSLGAEELHRPRARLLATLQDRLDHAHPLSHVASEEHPGHREGRAKYARTRGHSYIILEPVKKELWGSKCPNMFAEQVTRFSQT